MPDPLTSERLSSITREEAPGIWYGQPGDEEAAKRGECVYVVNGNEIPVCCNRICKKHNPEHWSKKRG